MKKLFIPCTLCAGLFCCNVYGAFTGNCVGAMCLEEIMSVVELNSIPTNCSSYNKYCYGGGSLNGAGGYAVYHCTGCKSGFTLDGNQGAINLSVAGCLNTVYEGACVCKNCTTGSWGAAGTGYEKRTYCNSSTCTQTTQYRCAAGYYGTSTNGTSGCTSCKTATSNNSATSTAGSTVITSCYIPSGTSFSDDKGSGTYNANCYYSN